MSATSPALVRVLPADVYDTLELSALAFGGIGAGNWADAEDAPCCIQGHSFIATEVYEHVRNAGLSVGTNDCAVHAINARKGRSALERNARVSWPEYTAETGIVRGEQ